MYFAFLIPHYLIKGTIFGDKIYVYGEQRIFADIETVSLDLLLCKLESVDVR
jgi:hypothetical protein